MWLMLDSPGNDPASPPGSSSVTTGTSNKSSATPQSKSQAVDVRADDQVMDQDEVKKEINSVLMMLMPWGISILLHVGLILIAVFLVWSTVKQVQKEEPIIPSARLSETPGASLSMSRSQRTQSSSAQARKSLTKTESTSSLSNQKVKMDTRVIGVAGGGMGAKASPFGAQVGSGDQLFGAKMYGSGGNARFIAYVIDASGSLIDTLPFVLNELKRSVSELSDKQKFTVIFFQDDKVIEVPPPGLKTANVENKTQVAQWLDSTRGNVTPGGRTSPMGAIKRALQYRPHLIFILSDNITGQGQYERDQRELLAEIQAANVGGTKINTIQFLYPDPLTRYKDASGRSMRGTLEMISENTGGVYKFVDASELGLR